MKVLVLVLALLGFVAPVVAQNVIELEPNSLVAWDSFDDGAIFRVGDLEMRLELIYPEGETDWIDGAKLHVSGVGPDFTLFGVAGLSGFGELGYFQIDRVGGWSVVFSTYTGGAHCCMAVQSALLGPDGPVIAELGMFDGETVEPLDLDGDGLYEFRLWDGRFNYIFDSYAGSFTPIVIYDTENGVPRDVTTDPEYYSEIKHDMRQQAAYCGGSLGWSAAACAAMAANGTRIGRYEIIRANIETHLATGRFDTGWDDFSFCFGDECSDRHEFTDFLEALDFALESWGYL